MKILNRNILNIRKYITVIIESFYKLYFGEKKMNFKKIISICLILVAIASTVSAISAAGIEFENGVLTINDLQFKIPEGYSLVENENDTDVDDGGEDIDGTHVDEENTCDFRNGAGDELKITVGILKDDKKIDSINPVGFEKKNIAGKDGFLKIDADTDNDDDDDNDDNNDKYEFEYLEDGKLVKIQASSEDLINQILS